MTTLKQLINEIDNEDMQFQILTNGECTLKTKGKGRNQYLETTFSSAPENMGKEALIIWVDKLKLKNAISKAINP